MTRSEKAFYFFLVPMAAAIVAALISSFTTFHAIKSAERSKKQQELAARRIEVTESVILILRNGSLSGQDENATRRYTFPLPPDFEIRSGEQVVKNVILKSLTVKNTGTEVIRKEDFITPLHTILPPGIKALNKARNSETDSNWTISGESKLQFNPVLLNPGEAIHQTAYFSFDENPFPKKWEWNGKVVGVKNFDIKRTNVIEEFEKSMQDSEGNLQKTSLQGAIFNANEVRFLVVWLLDWDILWFVIITATVLLASYGYIGKIRRKANLKSLNVWQTTLVSISCVCLSEVIFSNIFRTISSIGGWKFFLNLHLPFYIIHLLVIAFLSGHHQQILSRLKSPKQTEDSDS